MTKFELFSFLTVSFLIFLVFFLRVNFIFNITITSFSLPLAFILFAAITSFIFTVVDIPKLSIESRFLTLSVFMVASIVVFLLAYPISRTYDLSWDGQGYHQTAIIALADGWNPMYDTSIVLQQRLPSQIFAEGYPSALWEMQSTIYSIVGKINAAKVMNVVFAGIAFCFLFITLRTLRVEKLFAILLGILIVLQPVFLNQVLTYMQDGVGYQLFIITMCSLLLVVLKPLSFWPIYMFVMCELLLIGTKYSHLPLAFVVGLLFLIIVGNRWLNKDLHVTKTVWISISAIAIIGMVMLYLPYGRNLLYHKYPFYPTNKAELMGSVTYNNIPLNIADSSKFSLLFYGMFSSSQNFLSGDPRNKENVALLKVPFTFTLDEIVGSASLFNNRVGAGGVLYSGLITASFVYLLVMSFRTDSQKERYTIYAIYTTVGVILFLSLLSPTPNLFRYNSQLQLIPFVIVIPLFAVFRQKYIKAITATFLILMIANVGLYGGAILQRNVSENKKLTAQLSTMKKSGKTYNVKAQQFYSNYVLLGEKNVPFHVVNDLNCPFKERDITSSSNTTHFCKE